MRFSTDASSLLAGLQTTKRALATQTTMPILECVKITAHADHITLLGCDLDVWVQTAYPAKVDAERDTPDTCAVRPKRLIDTLRALPDDARVEVRLSDDYDLTMEADAGTYTMHAYEGDDYPDVPGPGEDEQIAVIGGEAIVGALDKTAFAVSDDSLRPAMMGVYFEQAPSHTEVVSTDGHRLARLRETSISSKQDGSFVLPEKAASLTQALTVEPHIRVADSVAEVYDQGVTIIARLIEAEYPNYEAVIPDGNDKRMAVDRAELLAAVERVGLYSPSVSSQIRLRIMPDDVKLTAEDVERSSEAEEVVPCEFDSDNMEIGFNSDYLAEVLGNVSCDEVVFRLDSPNRAAIVEPLGDDTDDITMLVMPVMLNSYA